jgi:glycosyltransferase involved in cell wall biosynthesis
MKVAVYDMYWPTGGGGEKFAAGIAAALAGEHDVTLIAHDELDTNWLGERLQLDLSGVRRDVQPPDAGAVSHASARYDLFVNASYCSADPNRARHGLYVVHFPGLAPGRVERAQRRLSERAARTLDAAATVAFGEGFYLPEWVPPRPIHWTSGEATMTVASHAGDSNPGARGPVPVVVLLGRFVPAAVGPLDVEALVGGRVVGRATLTAPRSRADRRSVALGFVVDMAPGEWRTVTLRSPSWVPHEHGVGTDPRRLGVPVIGAQAGGGWRQTLAQAAPTLVAGRNHLDFLDSYDRILSNSVYTQGWVRRLWSRDSDVFHPPVTLMPRGDKRPVILSVGRFFLPGTGHNKKQLELVEAFRRLNERGTTGWELHLVGGCSPEHAAYLEQIREAAMGLPVVIHPDATGAELRGLYAQASILWHAAGLNEDIERHPERYEHFGITTVEAMSAGAVPVVIDAAGQAEIVDQGVSGYRFRTLDELVRRSEVLIANPGWRRELAHAAQQRAQAFGWTVFADRIRHEIASLAA